MIRKITHFLNAPNEWQVSRDVRHLHPQVHPPQIRVKGCPPPTTGALSRALVLNRSRLGAAEAVRSSGAESERGPFAVPRGAVPGPGAETARGRRAVLGLGVEENLPRLSPGSPPSSFSAPPDPQEPLSFFPLRSSSRGASDASGETAVTRGSSLLSAPRHVPGTHLPGPQPGWSQLSRRSTFSSLPLSGKRSTCWPTNKPCPQGPDPSGRPPPRPPPARLRPPCASPASRAAGRHRCPVAAEPDARFYALRGGWGAGNPGRGFACWPMRFCLEGSSKDYLIGCSLGFTIKVWRRSPD
jgi:hypothetical protein